MTLADAKVGDELKVIGRVNGRGVGHGRRRGCGCACETPARDVLAAVGVRPGDRVVVMQAAPFHGPVLLRVPSLGVIVAVGRGMAEKVEVEPADASA